MAKEQAPLVRCATLKEQGMVTSEKASRLRSLLRCLCIGVPDDRNACIACDHQHSFKGRSSPPLSFGLLRLRRAEAKKKPDTLHILPCVAVAVAIGRSADRVQ